MTALSDQMRAGIDAPAFATLATLAPDGQPRLTVVWAKTDGDATATIEGGGDLIQDLSRSYTGGPYTFDSPGKVRVVLRITPTRAVYSDPFSPSDPSSPSSRRANSKRR